MTLIIIFDCVSLAACHYTCILSCHLKAPQDSINCYIIAIARLAIEPALMVYDSM